LWWPIPIAIPESGHIGGLRWVSANRPDLERNTYGCGGAACFPACFGSKPFRTWAGSFSCIPVIWRPRTSLLAKRFPHNGHAYGSIPVSGRKGRREDYSVTRENDSRDRSCRFRCAVVANAFVHPSYVHTKGLEVEELPSVAPAALSGDIPFPCPGLLDSLASPLCRPSCSSPRARFPRREMGRSES
jgi:hypothetical protein